MATRQPVRVWASAMVVLWRAAVVGVAALLMGSIPAAAQDDTTGLTIALNPYKGSGVSGWAALTPVDKGVQVEMAVEGAAVTGDHPTHIHTGTCANFDPNPLIPLTTVVLDPLSDDGTSRTTVAEVEIAELLADDYVILIHKSADELTNYFVCGDLKQSNAVVGPLSAGSMAAPGTGVGSAVKAPVDSTSAIAFAIAAALAVAGVWIRRRSPSSV